MKKFISIIFTITLIFSCFGLTAFAENSSITISEDYQTLSIDGESYSRFNASMLEFDCYETDKQITLSKAQQEAIASIELFANEQENIISVDITFKDGAYLSITFLRDDYLDEYNEIINNLSQNYVIDFGWPEDNTVVANRDDFFGNAIYLKSNVLEWCDYFYVTASSSDNSMTVVKGALITYDNEYYYVDFAESGIADGYSFSPYNYDTLSAHEITNEVLLKSLVEAEEAYYADDLGFFFDDDFTETISAVFLIFIFAIIPFAIFIVFLVLAIRSKTVYRKLFSTICILSGAELAIFAIITTFVMMVK